MVFVFISSLKCIVHTRGEQQNKYAILLPNPKRREHPSALGNLRVKGLETKLKPEGRGRADLRSEAPTCKLSTEKQESGFCFITKGPDH